VRACVLCVVCVVCVCCVCVLCVCVVCVYAILVADLPLISWSVLLLAVTCSTVFFQPERQ